MKNKGLLKIILVLSIVFSSVIYASYNTNLQMEGDAYLRAHEGLRISNVEAVGGSNGAYEKYSSKFTKYTTSMFVELPPSSSFTYQVTIENTSSKNYIVSNITTLSNSGEENSNLEITNNLTVGKALVSSNQNTTFEIEFRNNSETETIEEEILVLEYDFLQITHASQLTLNSSYTSCQTVQCALDELDNLLERWVYEKEKINRNDKF